MSNSNRIIGIVLLLNTDGTSETEPVYLIFKGKNK